MGHEGNSSRTLEIVNFAPIELVRADASDYFRGYAVVWYDGTPATEYRPLPHVRERIMSNSFDGILAKIQSKEVNVQALYNHSKDFVLGETINGTAFLDKDAKGLSFVIPYDPNDPDHAKTKAKIAKGIIKGSSFDAAGKEAMRKESHGQYIRNIIEVELFREFSLVHKPAYKTTTAELATQLKRWDAVQERIERSKLF